MELLLLAYFFGCIRTYRIGKHILVEGMGLHSAEFIMLIIYVVGILSHLIFPWIGRWIILFILIFWFVIQFFCHWRYTIFGASDTKIKGYYQCFSDTVRLFPKKEDRLVTDFYHIFLHILILVNIALIVIILFMGA